MELFITHSSSKRNVKTVVITFAVMFALAFFALAINLAAWIFAECMVLVIFFITYTVTKKTVWTIEFKGTALTLTNMGNKQSYVFKDMKAIDFVLIQTPAQKEKNIGDFGIGGEPFRMYDVEKFNRLKEYIAKNFE